jgi:NAD+ synthetase
VFIQQSIETAVNGQLATLTQAVAQMPDTWALDTGTQGERGVAAENNQAISRATLLRLLGNVYNALPLATSDKSELYMGYATVNGDMSGALAPLGDVVKTRVRALARWINTHPAQTGLPANAIPVRCIERPPSAELAKDPDTGLLIEAETALMPYAVADEIIWRIETLHQSPPEMLQTTFYYEQHHRVSKAQKQQWLERFYARMASAVFKWWVAPPILIVDSNGSIAKSDYQHMITACRIHWWPQSMDDIQTALQDEPANTAAEKDHLPPAVVSAAKI